MYVATYKLILSTKSTFFGTMEQFITQIQTKSKIETQDDITIAEPQQRRAETQEFSINSPEDVLEALRSKPDLKLVSRILQWLTSCKDQSSDIQIRQLGPKAVQIIYALVNNTIPEYWHILSGNGASEYTKQRRRVIMCLRSVAGIGAIISRVRDLLSRLKGSQISATLPAADKSQALDELLNILEGILDGNECINLIWRAIHACDEQISPKSLQWKDLLSLVASGKLLAIAAEASSVSNDGGRELKDGSWIGNGNLYTTWLGRNIQYMNNNVRQDDVEGRRSTSQLLSKALSLGYRSE